MMRPQAPIPQKLSTKEEGLCAAVAMVHRIDKRHEAIAARFNERLVTVHDNQWTALLAVRSLFIQKFDAFALEIVPLAYDPERPGQIHKHFPELLSAYADRIIHRHVSSVLGRLRLPYSEDLARTLIERLTYRTQYWTARVSCAILDAESSQRVDEPPAQREVKKAHLKNFNYAKIDARLRAIAGAIPHSQAEIFAALHKLAPLPNAQPFKTAGGWKAGFQKDPAVARVWLSKRWRRLGLPPLPRGPKRQRI